MDINDRDLLAKTLQAEAGNQGLGGMLAAGSVIMNRTQTPGYGSGLRGVILKPGQFSAWNSLTGYAGGEQGQDMLNMRPSSAAYQAADKLLTGDYQDQTGGATHYYNDAISNPKWGQKRAGGDWQRIGDHIFGFADAGRGKRSPQATLSTQGTAPMMQQEEETPRGLLGGLGVQKMQEGAPGETGQRFYERDSFKDTAALLAQGFGRMGIMGMEEIADGIAKQRTEDKAKNKTVEYLRKSGRSDLADAVESGSLGAREAAGLLFAKPKDDSTALMKNYEFYISKGMSPEQAMAAVKSGTTINTGDALKVLSDGRVLMSDPEAPDGYRVITPPGSKAATEAAQSEARDESRESSGSIMGQNVIQTAARVRELISPRSVGYGSLLKTLPESDARELQKEVDALGAIASSENLNLMRQESPTGGALGNVSDRDIQLLKDKSGAIDPGSKPEVFRQQVDEYELFLLQTIHGEKAGRQIFDQTRPPPAPQSAAPVTFSPADVALVKKYSSPPKTEEQ